MATVIEIPLYLEVGKKKPKKYWLNMNGYRNWHHHLNSDLKILFKKSITIPKVKFNKVKITYTLYFKNRTKRDGMNVCSVISKFFLDSLVQEGVLIDDDYTVVQSEQWIFGGIKDRDYCEVTIDEIA